MNFVPNLGNKTGIMPAAVTFLPTILSNEGYSTGIVTANGFLCSEYEIGDKYDYEECLPPKDTEFDALALHTRGVALAEKLNADKAPWFLHLHLVDPHLPYNPPTAYLDEVNALPTLTFDFSNASAQTMQLAWDGQSTADQGLFLAHTIARYQALTRYLDDEINGLLSNLSEQGLLEDTLIVLFADHGEQLFENGKAGHTYSLHSQETNVMAAFWAKNLLPKVWTGLTSHHDLVPTILDQLQLEVPSYITGITAGERTDDTVIFSYLLTDIQFYVSTVLEDHKLIYSWHDGSKLLYNIAIDPDEQNDIYDNTLEITTKLWLALDEELARLQPLISLAGPVDAVP
jgi:arylsulfatase A-like enzyme